MKRILVAAAVAVAAALAVGTAAGADPSFGPGNGQQVGDKCHPPGQTVDVPGCK